MEPISHNLAGRKLHHTHLISCHILAIDWLSERMKIDIDLSNGSH